MWRRGLFWLLSQWQTNRSTQSLKAPTSTDQSIGMHSFRLPYFHTLNAIHLFIFVYSCRYKWPVACAPNLRRDASLWLHCLMAIALFADACCNLISYWNSFGIHVFVQLNYIESQHESNFSLLQMMTLLLIEEGLFFHFTFDFLFQ